MFNRKDKSKFRIYGEEQIHTINTIVNFPYHIGSKDYAGLVRNERQRTVQGGDDGRQAPR